MIACPHCNATEISAWRLVLMSRHLVCFHCGGHFCVLPRELDVPSTLAYVATISPPAALAIALWHTPGIAFWIVVGTAIGGHCFLHFRSLLGGTVLPLGSRAAVDALPPTLGLAEKGPRNALKKLAAVAVLASWFYLVVYAGFALRDVFEPVQLAR